MNATRIHIQALLLLQASTALLLQGPPRCRRVRAVDVGARLDDPRYRRTHALHVGTSLDDFPARRCADAADLRVTGKLPPWLQGAVIRNGPGRFTTATQNCSHLFDGVEPRALEEPLSPVEGVRVRVARGRFVI